MSIALTTQQEQVLASIAAGQTVTAAAAEAGVHRNTVSYWLRGSKRFNDALASAQQHQRICWREMAETRAAAAFSTLDQILADPQAPAAVRVRVAMALIAMASTTLEPRDEGIYVDFTMPSSEPALAAPPHSKNAQKVHKNAQTKIGELSSPSAKALPPGLQPLTQT